MRPAPEAAEGVQPLVFQPAPGFIINKSERGLLMAKSEGMRFFAPSVVSPALLSMLLLTCALAQGQSPAPTFGQPTISGIQGVGFEQDLRLDPTKANRVYTSVPGSLSSDTSWIWHSEAGGKTFTWVVAGAAKEGKPGLAGTPACAGGGDSELDVDSGGNLYFNDLT